MLQKLTGASKVNGPSKGGKALTQEQKAGERQWEEAQRLPVRYLKGVGPQRAALLSRLGVQTVADLIFHFPRRHEDRGNLKPIAALGPGELETFRAVVGTLEERKPRPNLVVTRVELRDASGVAWGIWFNQPFVKNYLQKGTRVIVTGKVRRRFGFTEVLVTEYEEEDGQEKLHTGRVVPVYPAVEGLSQRFLRSLIFETLGNYAASCPDHLPKLLSAKYGFPSLEAALTELHFPTNRATWEAARKRLAYTEFFLFQFALALQRRGEREYEKGIAHAPDGELAARFYQFLPFSLTQAQKKVIAEVNRDMESARPMARLVQGDVGSGKTIVAAAALVKAVASGYQGAMMAPTEILAAQHYLNLKELLSPLGIRVVLLTGSFSPREREELLASIAVGASQVVVGTHALIQADVKFCALSLAVTDEQHRFGVQQRALLAQKGYHPDILVMTATPIPRTLALTLYGDLDLSLIDELPPGRQKVTTYYLPERRRGDAYALIRREVAAGRQAYVVCPLITESEVLTCEAATKLFAKLQTEVFPDLSVGLLHGRLKLEEKEEVMRSFRQGKIQILVTTTVIEVGVDVPNASVMLIEGAERFGLAQLHQLRGRVGRGSYPATCILMGKPSSREARARLQAITRLDDGFALAEEDLRLRGPGEFFGTRQHGLPEFKIADILRDQELLEKARQDTLSLYRNKSFLNSSEGKKLLSFVKEKFGKLNW